MFVVFGKGESRLHPTYIDDCVDAFIAGMEKKDLAGEVFIIAGQHAVTVAELADTIAVALDVRTPLRVPLWLGKAGVVLMENAAKIIPFTPPLNEARLKFFTENRAFVIDKARKLLGYNPQYTFQEGVKKTVAWYKEKRYL
jgi:nucleoside-diphosphate-sugar epimerase